MSFSLPAFQMEPEKNDKNVPAYVPPKKLGQFFVINNNTKNKVLVQIEREMNPRHHHYGKEFFSVRPGMKWDRVGFFSQSREKCWINLFNEFKDQEIENPDTGEKEVQRTRIAEVAEAFVNCAAKEAGGVWGDYELVFYTPKK